MNIEQCQAKQTDHNADQHRQNVNEKLEDGCGRDKQIGTRIPSQIAPGPHLSILTGNARWSLNLYGGFRCVHMSSPFL